MGLMGSSTSKMENIRNSLYEDFNADSCMLVVAIGKNDLKLAEEAASKIGYEYASMKQRVLSLDRKVKSLTAEKADLVAEVTRLKNENEQLNEQLNTSRPKTKRRKNWDIDLIVRTYMETHSERKAAIAGNCDHHTAHSILLEAGALDSEKVKTTEYIKKIEAEEESYVQLAKELLKGSSFASEFLRDDS